MKLTSLRELGRFFIANIPFLVLIILLNLAVYANSLHGQFVSDDIGGTLHNPKVEDLSKSMFVGHRHIQYVLWGVSYRLFGENSFPMHLVSLSIHIVNVILLFAIVYFTFERSEKGNDSATFGEKVAIAASLLFSVHPVVTESVSWISAITYLLVAFFLFCTLIMYLIYKNSGDKKYLYLTYCVFIVTIILTDNFWNYMIPPFLIVFDQLILEKKINLTSAKKLIPMLLIVIALFTYGLGGIVSERAAQINTGDNTPFLRRLPYSIYTHGQLLVFPNNLTLYHEGEVLTYAKYKMMIVTTVLITLALPFIYLTNRRAAGLILLSYVIVLPMFSPVQVAWFIAERYLYIPAALFCILLAWIILSAEKKYGWKNFAAVTILVLLIVYSVRSIYRNSEWKTPKRLWLATERVGPNSPRVHNNLGDIFGAEGNFDLAIWHFKQAIDLNPNYADAMHNLGNTYLQLGQLDPAEQYLLMSLEKNPYLYQAMYKLGVIAYNRGNIGEARGWFEQTLAINPADTLAKQVLQFINSQPAQSDK